MSQMGIPSQLLLISYSPILTREKWKFTPSKPGMFHDTAKCDIFGAYLEYFLLEAARYHHSFPLKSTRIY